MDPVQVFGVNNTLLGKITGYFPRIRIIARGSEIKAVGEQEELDRFEEKIQELIDYLHHHNQLTAEELDMLMLDNIPVLRPEKLQKTRCCTILPASRSEHVLPTRKP